MVDEAAISWWAGLILALAALVVIALALVRDRSRGRRRCPKCWYDMGSVTGTMCPECGKTQAKERAFFRTRRRWRRAAVGAVMLVLAAGVAAAPALYTGKWAQYVPVPVMRFVLSFFKESADAVDQKTMITGTLAKLTTWERLLLASDMSRDLRWWLDASAPERQRAMDDEMSDRRAALQRGTTAPAPRAAEKRRGTYEMQSYVPALRAECRVMLPELMEALASTDGSLAAFAGGALYAMGRRAASELPEVRRLLLEAPSEHARESILRLLAGTNIDDERTMQAIRAAARGDASARIRHDATIVLVIREPGAPGTMDAVLDGLERGQEPVIMLRTLGWYAHSDARRQPGLDAMWWSVNVAPKGAQGTLEPPEQEDPRVLPALVGALEHPEPAMRLEAATMLGGLGARLSQASGALRKQIVVETDETARRAMITAYVKAPHADVEFLLPELMQAVRGEDDEVRRWAAWTLAGCGTRAASVAPDLRMGALEDAEDRQGIYCDALGFIGPDGWRALDELVRSDAPARRPAARALGMSGTRQPEAVAYLLAALRDARTGVRVTAALGLHFCDGNEGVVRALASAVRRDEDWEVRRSALISLAGVADVGALVETCVAALKDSDKRVRDLAILTLGEKMKEHEEAREALRIAARDADPEIREAAGAALEDKQQ